MRKKHRYCQHCSARALTPRPVSRPGMRPGRVYRKNHDLCARCWREALAATLRRERAEPLAA